MTRSQRARRTRDRLRADAPHYTRADIGTVYVADRLRIDVDAAERLGSRPSSIMVGDCSPVFLHIPPVQRRDIEDAIRLKPRAAPTLSQLLARPTSTPANP